MRLEPLGAKVIDMSFKVVQHASVTADDSKHYRCIST